MTRGPVPKRSDQRRRRNNTGTVQAPAGDNTPTPPPLRPGLHPLAVAWYESLPRSGQSRYYEPSDWMHAQLVAEAIAAFAETPKASMLAAIMSAASNLLVTEGDRRRLRLEMLKAAPTDEDEQAADDAVSGYLSLVSS